MILAILWGLLAAVLGGMLFTRGLRLVFRARTITAWIDWIAWSATFWLCIRMIFFELHK